MIGVSHSWLSDWEKEKDYNHFMKRICFLSEFVQF